MLDQSQKRRELAAARLGLHPDSAWNTTFYHRAIRTKIGQELRERYDLRQELPHRILTLLTQLDEDNEKAASVTRPQLAAISPSRQPTSESEDIDL
jgi:hypothetical protein